MQLATCWYSPCYLNRHFMKDLSLITNVAYLGGSTILIQQINYFYHLWTCCFCRFMHFLLKVDCLKPPSEFMVEIWFGSGTCTLYLILYHLPYCHFTSILISVSLSIPVLQVHIFYILRLAASSLQIISIPINATFYQI